MSCWLEILKKPTCKGFLPAWLKSFCSYVLFTRNVSLKHRFVLHTFLEHLARNCFFIDLFETSLLEKPFVHMRTPKRVPHFVGLTVLDQRPESFLQTSITELSTKSKTLVFPLYKVC